MKTYTLMTDSGQEPKDWQEAEKLIRNDDFLFVSLPDEIITISFDDDDKFVMAGKKSSSFREFDTAKEMWDYVKKTYCSFFSRFKT